MISTKILNIDDELNWIEIIKKSTTATFFQTKEWLSLWVKHFLSKGQSTSGRLGVSLIFGVFDDSELIGIAPLSIIDNHIEFLGTTPVLGEELVTDYGDIIALKGREKEVWKGLIDRIKNNELRIKKIELNFIREDSPSYNILKDFKGKCEEIEVSPYLDLPKSWDEYLLNLNRHDRHELRRKIKKSESEGAFKICYDGDPHDISEFFRLMALSNEQKRNFLSDQMKSFFQDIFDTFYPSKMLQLCFMKIEGINIASALVFLHKNQLLLYNSGFDPSYSRLSPGLILKAYLIKYAIEHKMTGFDFLRGGERYKYNLGGRNRKLYRIKFD